MIRRIAGQRQPALVAGLAFALMSVGTAGQQVGRAPVEVRVAVAPVPAVALDRLEVLDDTGGTVGAWEAAPLRQRVTMIGQPAGDPGAAVILAPGARAVAFLWVTLDAGRATPSSIVHRVTARASDGSIDVATTASVHVRSTDGDAIGAPVHGGPWVAVRGPSPASGHRLSLVALNGVARVPQRFAVDWVRLGDDGTLFRRSGADVTDWFGYDTPVVAVADGTVALVRDGMADTTPRATPATTVDAKDAPGNTVVIDIGHGRFATYAHLRAGSVSVKEGERVRAGQPLARIGNSGNSGGPHLHFHVGDAVEPLGGEGLPFSMDRFDLIGRVPGLGPMLAGTPWAPQAYQPSRVVTAEMPLENMVVRFLE